MKILVLAGGDSEERDVSLESGQQVSSALSAAGHHVDLLDPRENPLAGVRDWPWQIAIPMVHGVGGEDGTLQAQLEFAGLPFVGSCSDSSELTFDKIRTVELLRANDLPVPHGGVFTMDGPKDGHQQLLDNMSLPVVVKPARQGSSVGVSVVRQAEEMLPAVNLALQFGDECLIERYIAGREITVPVIDGRALPTVEIRTTTEWYNYAAKYEDDTTQLIVEPEGVRPDIGNLAVRCCDLCDVTGIARVDFRINPDGHPFVLEINSIPGMTSHSLVPRSAESLGLSIADICEQAITREMERLTE